MKILGIALEMMGATCTFWAAYVIRSHVAPPSALGDLIQIASVGVVAMAIGGGVTSACR